MWARACFESLTPACSIASPIVEMIPLAQPRSQGPFSNSRKDPGKEAAHSRPWHPWSHALLETCLQQTPDADTSHSLAPAPWCWHQSLHLPSMTRNAVVYQSRFPLLLNVVQHWYFLRSLYIVCHLSKSPRSTEFLVCGLRRDSKSLIAKQYAVLQYDSPNCGHPTNIFILSKKLANHGTRIWLTDTSPCKVRNPSRPNDIVELF